VQQQFRGRKILRNKARALGETIKTLRKQRGMTQEQLAERAELHPTYIAKLESGERFPSLETLIELAGALDIPLSSIVKSLEPKKDLEVVRDADRYPDSRASSGTQEDPVREELLEETVSILRECETKEIAFFRDLLHLAKRYFEK